MKKYCISIIFFFYIGLILYLFITGYLSHFLAPNMQKYCFFAIPILGMIAVAAIFNQKFVYSFKFFDFILILPLFAVFFIGDGQLSVSLAKNRSNNFKVATSKLENQVGQKEEQSEKPNYSTQDFDFTKIDYDIVDEAYSAIVDYLSDTKGIQTAVGKTVRIRGFAVKDADYITPGFFAIGKYNISCCTADASVFGLLVDSDLSKIEEGGWYEISGVLEKITNKWGYETLAIRAIKLTEIDKTKEQLYIYPCYAYGNGTCSSLTQYNLK